MKKNVIRLLGLSFLIYSCSKYGVEFEVRNNRTHDIDSIIISNGFTQIKQLDLKQDSIYEVFLDFNENVPNRPKGDGSFNIQTFSAYGDTELWFGYFSNGIPLADRYELIIEKDTINISEIMN